MNKWPGAPFWGRYPMHTPGTQIEIIGFFLYMHMPGAQGLKSMQPPASMCTQGAGCTLNFENRHVHN